MSVFTSRQSSTSARRAVIVAAAASVALSSLPAFAADVTWDTVHTPSDNLVTGGTGAWNLSLTNWTVDAGVNNVQWVNANNDTAIFGGTAGTVTLGVPITVGGLTFNDNAGYLITGNTLTFGVAGSITTNVDASITSALAGNVLITKAGNGTLTLNTASTRTGGLEIDAGTVLLTNATAFGTAAAPITIDNGGSLKLAGITLGNGAGAIALNSGGTIIADNAASRIDKTINVAAGSTVNFDSGSVNSYILSLTGGGNNRLAGGDASTTFVVKGSGIVRIGDSGQSRTHTARGTWQLDSGTLRVRTELGLGDAANDINFRGGSFDTDGQSINLASGRVLDFGTGGGTLSQTAGTLTLDDAGQITGANNITKTGAGTVLISNANTGFTGDVVVSSGVFDIRNADAVGTGATQADISLAGSTTLNLRNNGSGNNGTIAFGHDVTLTGNATISVERASANSGNTIAIGEVSLAGNQLTVNTSTSNSYLASFTNAVLGGNATITGNATVTTPLDFGSAARTLTKSGTGTLIVPDVLNAVTGNTINIDGGTVRAQVADLPASDFAVNVNAGTIDLASDVDSSISSTQYNFTTTGSYGIAARATTTGVTAKKLTVTGGHTVASGQTLTFSGADDFDISVGAINNSGTVRAVNGSGGFGGVYITGAYTGNGSDLIRTVGNPITGAQGLDGSAQASEGGVHFANGLSNQVYRIGFGDSTSVRSGSLFVENGSTVTVTDRIRHLEGVQGGGSHFGGITLRGGSSLVLGETAIIDALGVSGTNFYRHFFGGDGNAANKLEIQNTAIDFGAAHGTAGNSSTYLKFGGLNFVQHAASTGTNFTVNVASSAGRNGYVQFEGLDNGVSGASAGWTIMGAGTNTDGVLNVVTPSATPIDGLVFVNSRFVDVQGTGQLNVAPNVRTTIATDKTVTKKGTGTLTFDGSVTGAGTLRVEAGQVNINNASFTPALDIVSGTVAGGVSTGGISTLGKLTVGGSGVLDLSPAGATTTWSVAGGVEAASGATFQMNIFGGNVDSINNSGLLTLDGGTYNIAFNQTGGLAGAFYQLIGGSGLSGSIGTWNATGLDSGYALSFDGTYGLGVFLTTPSAPAAWSNANGGNWSVNGNWNNNAAPNAADASAFFAGAISTPQTVTVDTPITAGSVYFNNATASYTIDTSSNALTLNGTGGATVEVLGGSHTISGAQGVVAASDVALKAGAGTTLSIQNISGAGAVSFTGAGTVNVSGANSYGGATSVNAGTVNLTGSVSSTSLSVANGATLDVQTGGSLAGVPAATINGSVTSAVDLGLASAGGTGTIGMATGTTLSIGKDGASASSFTPTINSAGAITLRKVGDSTITLSSVAFTGGTTPVTNWSGNVQVDEGKLVVQTMLNQLTTGRAITGAVSVASGATLSLNPVGGGENIFQNDISGPGTVEVQSGSESVNFSGALTGAATVNVDSAAGVSFTGTSANSIGALNLNAGNATVASGKPFSATAITTAASRTFTTAGTTSTGSITGGGSTNVTAGTLTIAQKVTPLGANTQGGLSITGGKVDLTNNQLTITTASDATIRSQIAAGRNGGAWDGATGITSSTAAIDPLTYGVGHAATGGGSKVSYSLLGDLDLDGDVDFDDAFELTNNYGTPSGSVWVNGDTDYDGDIDFDDAFSQVNNYGGALATTSGGNSDGVASLVYDASTGTLKIEHDFASGLKSFNITIGSGAPFSFNASEEARWETENKSFSVDLATQQGFSTNTALGATFLAANGYVIDDALGGTLLASGLSQASLLQYLTITYGIEGQTGTKTGDLIVIPEPTTLGLLGLAAMGLGRRRRTA